MFIAYLFFLGATIHLYCVIRLCLSYTPFSITTRHTVTTDELFSSESCYTLFNNNTPHSDQTELFSSESCLSDPKIAELREMTQSFSMKLHSETQVSVRLGMSVGRPPRHAQNPLLGERRETLSITHHNNPPSHHHMYIISSHQLTTTFLSYYNVT